MKSLMPLTATAPSKAFFDGAEPWRILALPFGGPIPSPKSPRGVDLDGQYFSENTDIYGHYAALKAAPDRLVDWHHSLKPEGGRGGDPMGVMNGVTLGKAVLDRTPDEAGYWVDFWARAGERRMDLVRQLVERGTQLFASAQPTSTADTAVSKATGEILRYPFLLLTITTAPQNTLAVVRPKALLAGLDSAEEAVSPALKALLTELDALGAELPQSHLSDGAGREADVKAGGVFTALQEAQAQLGEWESLRDLLRSSQAETSTDA